MPDTRRTPQSVTLAQWIATFLHHGGRLMVDPQGKLHTANDLSSFFDAKTDEEAQAALQLLGDLAIAYRQPNMKRQLKNLVLMRGAMKNGWAVLEAA